MRMNNQMTIEPFCTDDVATFLELATTEGWVAEQWEFAFLLTAFPQGCFCVRDSAGKGVAFVTSLLHERSGWIGNLIVADGQRGKGVGEALFVTALEALQAAGAETVWLTASKMGKSLYEKHGFAVIDTIFRWIGFSRQRHEAYDTQVYSPLTPSPVSGIDHQAWGDRRDALLTMTAGRGNLLIEESGFLVIQPCGDAMQFGPFSALDHSAAGHLFDLALRTVPSGTKVYLDAPASNHSAMRLFRGRRMGIAGANELMYAGVKPAYRADFLYGLATMGSCG